MTTELFNDVVEIIQIAVLFFCTIRMIKDGLVYKSLTAVFYVFGNVAFLVADVYWLAHMILKEGETPKFSAVEIGMAGVFLLYGAAILSHGGQKRTIKWISFPTLIAMGFTLANTACWIAWTDGWGRDIITGIAMGYMACVLAYCLDRYEQFEGKKLTGILAFCLSLIVLETASLHVSGSMVLIVEILRYCFWFSGIVFFIVKIYIYVIKKRDTSVGLVYSFSGFLFGVFAMYLSTGVMYEITELITIAMMNPIYLSVRREAGEA